MRISAYMEPGLDKKAGDERFYIKYYKYAGDGSISEEGAVTLQSGEYDVRASLPLIVALSDGREEYAGADVVSEIVVGELKKFRMPMFLNTQMKVSEEPQEEDKGEKNATGGVANINGSLGGVKKDSITLEQMQNMGDGMGGLIDMDEDEKSEEKTGGELARDTEKEEALRGFMRKVNRNVIGAGKEPWGEACMTAFLTGMVFTGERSFLFHLGGLRLIRKKGLSDYWEAVTREHTETVENSRRKKITCCIGSGEDLSDNMQVEDCSMFAGEGKKMVLLGEGVYKYVDLSELRRLLIEEKPPLEICKKIADKARLNGSAGDVSVVLFNFQ